MWASMADHQVLDNAEKNKKAIVDNPFLQTLETKTFTLNHSAKLNYHLRN